MPSGSATAAKAAEDVPSAAKNAMRLAITVPRMKCAVIAEPASPVWAVRATIAQSVSCVNSVRNTYVNAEGAVQNAF